MRLLNAATLTGAVVLLASVASAQGIGEAAAKEKQKRKASPKTAKVYTDDSIGRSMAPVTSSELPATAADAAAAQGTAQPTGDKPAVLFVRVWRAERYPPRRARRPRRSKRSGS